jgi:hypothetical protein
MTVNSYIGEEDLMSSDYLEEILSVSELKRIVIGLKALLPDGCDFIACRGLSGTAVAFPLGFITGLPVVVVRKRNDYHHSCAVVEGDPLGDYVIVDDCVETGTTVRTIVREIGDIAPAAQCLGLLLYSQCCYNDYNDYLKLTQKIGLGFAVRVLANAV